MGIFMLKSRRVNACTGVQGTGMTTALKANVEFIKMLKAGGDSVYSISGLLTKYGTGDTYLMDRLLYFLVKAGYSIGFIGREGTGKSMIEAVTLGSIEGILLDYQSDEVKCLMEGLYPEKEVQSGSHKVGVFGELNYYRDIERMVRYKTAENKPVYFSHYAKDVGEMVNILSDNLTECKPSLTKDKAREKICETVNCCVTVAKHGHDRVIRKITILSKDGQATNDLAVYSAALNKYLPVAPFPNEVANEMLNNISAEDKRLFEAFLFEYYGEWR